MKVINDSAREIWIRLPALAGAVVITDPGDPENARPIGVVSDYLQPGEVSREYPDLHRDLLLSTAGLSEYVEPEAPEPEDVRIIEEPPLLDDEDLDLTPTKPAAPKKTKKQDKPKRGRGRRT